MEEPSWKKTKLSLERPYKDDKGESIPVLLDITPDGVQVFESPQDHTKLLGENLRRIFIERGVDFFERQDALKAIGDLSIPQALDIKDDKIEPDQYEEVVSKAIMNPEELYKMRMEIMPQLFTALGEMTHARELLSLLLTSTPPIDPSPVPSLPSSTLTASIVTKPPPIPSVDAFNAQLTIGGKDEALRKAASLFKAAANNLERSRLRGQRYWVDALKIRRANWGLVPAPLPFGAPTGKGADKTSKDFFVSFGLEESPAHFRRRAVGHMATYETLSHVLVFPHRQRVRLQVSLILTDSTGIFRTASNSIICLSDASLEDSLKTAQREMVEEELFSVLIKEASTLPTASARVAERLIVIDAAQGTELKFELVKPYTSDERLSATCNLIYFALQGLLLSLHASQKSQRLSSGNTHHPPSIPNKAPLLQPIIDLLQYQVFCHRIKVELDKMVSALLKAGIPSSLRFDAVGESGHQLVEHLVADQTPRRIGGEALLPHLPQATLPIASIPQLVQLLSDEVERCLLNRLCEVGSQVCERVGATWFVDFVSGKAVGRWEGSILNFRIIFDKDFAIRASAYCLNKASHHQLSLLETYTPKTSISLVAWLQELLEKTMSES
ncbi:subunit 17 of mediator complex-domain-containing protein [Suillus paluster]|uniref:subunit 17 of mediator complex-domain-containing protein n=1 Tax=Suillus paluster TaxID=48578 RepID=UPI001B866A46|nr:subunit 17 of mediator complex-domain-containing protein [Suillus paluster]KAG1752739.1 subunit 17 of mediator complex-domain-containing protein [Suillus paluster]